MADFELSESAKSHLDLVCALAERNGWNAAINACRLLLPVEFGRLLRPLYKLEEPAFPSTECRPAEIVEGSQS